MRARTTTGSNAAPECDLAVGRLRVAVNVDGSPQPYSRLEREIVEDGQQFGTERKFTPPQSVAGVGLDAAWLPDQSRLITADRRVLVTVTVGGAGAPERVRRRLALALARSALSPRRPGG